MSQVFPGMKVAAYFPQVVLGEGVHTDSAQKSMYASLCGKLSVSSLPNRQTEYRVINKEKQSHGTPKINGKIIGRICKMSPRLVHVEILMADSKSCPKGYYGLIRLQDISPSTFEAAKGHLTNPQCVSMILQAVRLGDLVQATVSALAESNLFYLSTLDSSDGVLIAKHAITGQKMTPINQSQMICPLTKQVEHRKVALLSINE